MKTQIIIFLCILLLTGCGAFSNSRDTIDVDVHTGTEGLTINFLKDTPPKQVYENDNFPILVEFHNKGATDIETGKYSVTSDTENKGFGGGIEIDEEESTDEIKLQGRSVINSLGEQRILELTGYAKKMNIETITDYITVNVCYAYATDASADMCIDTDVYDLGRYEKSCKITNKAMNNGQGAPIGVTKITTTMMTYKGERGEENKVIPRFTIEITNFGKGQPVLMQTVDQTRACGSGSDIIKAQAWLYETELDCTPKLRETFDSGLQEIYGSISGKEGFVKLEQNKAEIICDQVEGISKAMGTYTSPLRIHLEYGYSEIISKKVEIRKR